MEGILSVFDRPPPFAVSPAAFAAVATFAVCGAITLACPSDWPALKRSYVVAITHSIVSFALASRVVAAHWATMTDWSLPCCDDWLWFGYSDEVAVPVAIAGGYLSFDLILGTVISPGMLDGPMLAHHSE
jgi:hypothetical protein